MKHAAQAGFSLVEALVAAGIVALACSAWLGACAAFARYAAHPISPVRAAAALLAEQTLRVAQDAWKYGSPGAAPSGTWRRSIDVDTPGASPVPAPVGVTATLSGGALEVTVRYTPDPLRPDDSGEVTMSGTLLPRAPLPGSALQAPGLIPAPSGAP